MTFVQIETKNGMINIDGYSRNKTLKGALKDLAREVSKIDKDEGMGILENLDDYVEMVREGMLNERDAYYIEAEEVPCASRYVFLNGDEEDYSEDNMDIEYAEGHWYLYIRFCAPDQNEEQTACTLTDEEMKFFDDTVARIKYSVNVRIPIEIMNHEQLSGKHKEALGICWAEDEGIGKPIPFRITVDEYFVHECFVALEKPYMKLEPHSLEQVIAHEIAHLHHWRHGKKHTELTQYICRLIERGEPHGLENSGTTPFRKVEQVTMAAMQPTPTTQQEESVSTMNKRTYYPIDEKTARLSHQMMSMRDYPEGSKTTEYRKYADCAYDLAERIAQERPKQAERAWRIAERYARKMADNLNSSSRIGTMYPSIMISGRGNFPVRKKEKQVAALDRNMQEFRELQGYIDRLERILYAKEVIRSDEEDAVEQLEDKLDKLETAQTQMKAVNAYYRKHKTLDGCPDLTEKERRQIEGDWARGWYKGTPFPPYALSNNNANMKRIRQRIEGLKREKSRESTEQEIECGGLAVTIMENVEEMRLQLFFEDKPEPEVRDLLKAEAFKWSPRNECWQRQLTDNARSAVKRVLKKLSEFSGNKEVNEYGN